MPMKCQTCKQEVAPGTENGHNQRVAAGQDGPNAPCKKLIASTDAHGRPTEVCCNEPFRTWCPAVPGRLCRVGHFSSP